MRQASKASIWTALIAVYIIWGTTYLAIRFAVETIPPFLMAGVRFLVPGLLFVTWSRIQKTPWPSWREWRSAIVVGLFLMVGGNGLVSWAEQKIPSSIAALLIAVEPIWIVLIDGLMPGGRRVGWKTALGIAIGFGGILMLIDPFNLSGDTQGYHPVSLLMLVLAGIFWAAGSLYNRDAQLPSSPMLSIGMQMLAGSAGLLLMGSLSGEWGRLDLQSISIESFASFLYLMVFGSMVAFSAYLWLLRVAPTPLVTTYAYVNPLIAVFAGHWFAHEPLTVRILTSALVIIGAVLLINFSTAGSMDAQGLELTGSEPGDD